MPPGAISVTSLFCALACCQGVSARASKVSGIRCFMVLHSTSRSALITKRTQARLLGRLLLLLPRRLVAFERTPVIAEILARRRELPRIRRMAELAVLVSSTRVLGFRRTDLGG